MERRYILSRFGVRCGHLEERADVRTGGDGTEEIVTVRTFESWPGRPGGSGGRTVETWVETRGGAPLSVSVHSAGFEGDTSAEGTVRGGKFAFRIRSSGREYSREIPCDPPPLFPRSIERLVRERGFEKGICYSYRTYCSETESIVTAVHEVLGRRTIRVAGRAVEAYAIRRTGFLPGVAETLFYDGAGRLLCAECTSMDSRLELAAREEALKPPSAQELAVARAAAEVASTVPIAAKNFLLPPPWRVEQVLYRLCARNGDGFPIDPVHLDRPPRQSLEKRDGRSAWLRIGRTAAVVSHGGGSQSVPAGDKDVTAFVAAGPLVQCDDPAIRVMASELAAGESDPRKIVRRIEAYVARTVADGQASAHLASAKQVHERLVGDCTELAVYFIALARAASIPARAVLGLVQSGHDAFRYHMWAQVRIGGQWIDVDPTRPGEEVRATHIALAESDLSGMGLGAAGAICAGTMGKLEIYIEEISAGGKTYRPGDALNAWRLAGGRFEDEYFGLSIPVPDGWEVVPRDRMPKKDMKREGIVLSLKKAGVATGTLEIEFAGSRRTCESEADIRASLPDDMRGIGQLDRIEISGRPAALAVRRGIMPDNARVLALIPLGRVRYNMDIRIRSAKVWEEAIKIVRGMRLDAW